MSILANQYATAASVTLGLDRGDYVVANYTNATVAIQAAIDYINGVGGGELKILEGTYDMAGGGASLSGIDNISIIGSGMDVTILEGGGLVKNSATPTTSISLQHMTINANNVSGENCVNLSSYTSDVYINRVKMQNTANVFPFHWGNVDGMVVENCIFEDGGTTLARDNAAGSQDPSSDRVTVFRDCYFIKTSASLGGGMITTGQTGNILVEGCHFVNTDGYKAYAAVSIENQTGNSKDVRVINNWMFGCGIAFGVSSNTNTIRKTVAKNNYILGGVGANPRGGITSSRSLSTEIKDNELYDTNYGVFIRNADRAIVSGNDIDSTDNSSSGAADRAGIDVDTTTYIDISRNTIKDALGRMQRAVRIRNSTDVAMSGNILYDTYAVNDIDVSVAVVQLEMDNNTIIGNSDFTGVTNFFPNNNVGYPTEIQSTDMTLKTANFTAVAGERSLVDTTGGAVTVTAPASAYAGMTFNVVDAMTQFSTNNCTVDFGTVPFHGETTPDNTDLLETDGDNLTYTYVDATVGWIRER